MQAAILGDVLPKTPEIIFLGVMGPIVLLLSIGAAWWYLNHKGK